MRAMGNKPIQVTVKKFLPVFVLLALLAGCVLRIPEEISPEEALFRMNWRIPPFADDMDADSLLQAVEKSREYYDRLPKSKEFRFGSETFTAEEMSASLLRFSELVRESFGTPAFSDRVREEFQVYKSIGGADRKGTVLFTGYYEPLLTGSLEKTEKFRYPLFRRPDDLVEIDLGQFREKYRGERIMARIDENRVLPYYSREEIDSQSVLEGKGLELLWLSDLVDLFFLQIQGSGIVALPDGRRIQVGYDSSNGRAYRSIGRLLIDEGEMQAETLSLQELKKYLSENPGKVQDVLNYNESYVFFRILEDGPVGSIGLRLTGGRSLATDRRLFPPGALGFVRTEKPVFDGNDRIVSWTPFSRFVLNQDTGGAILSGGRADLFCGDGARAEQTAGHMKQEGQLFFLVWKRFVRDG